MRRLIASSIFISFLLFGQTARAQYVLKQADEQYNLYNYSKAAELYLQAYKKDAKLYTAEHLANAYRLMRNYEAAEKWYAVVVGMKDSKPANLLTYAEMLKSNMKYKEAQAQYTRYYVLSPGVDKKQLQYWTSSCDSALKWLKNPIPVEVTNEQALNSIESDWGAVKYRNSVVFTSDRETKPTPADTKKKSPFYIRFDHNNTTLDKRTYGWTGNKYLNLYQQANADTVRSFPLMAGTDYHIGAASFTADGKEMYFTLTRLPNHQVKDTARITTITLDIYSSRLDPATGEWSKPIPFIYNREERYSLGDPFISPDGRTLYFVSNMPGGMGGTDIYYCVKDEAGRWKEPVNVTTINTSANERTPFVDAKGTIYFSTDGDKGMGGLDIFKAQRKGAGYGTKQNLGYPVNSPQDDFAYVLVDGTSSGYLSSNRLSGKGSDDIYSFQPLAIAGYKMEGIVYDKNTLKPISNSTVTLTKVKGIPLKVQTDVKGFFSFALTGNAEYHLRGEKTGYLTANRDSFSTAGITPNETLKRNLYLEKIQLKKAIRLENIYYDLNKDAIRPDAALELDKLIKIMKDNPTIVIQLASHTDSRADDDYNMELSRRRANAAVDYITTNGDIDEARIIPRGYGETRLLNKCANGVNCTEAEHQLNRRTEFIILKY
jgi:peptidoglycan-associated lipoprotein